MHVVGMVLHPERDCTGAVGSILEWAARRDIQVLGIDTEIRRLACTAEAVTAAELRQRADLLVSLGGDGTMLRAMRLADRQRSPVLGVNLGKLGFLAEVDVPDLADALSAIDNHEYTTEPRLAVDAVIGNQLFTAFNDIALVRFPGQKTAAVAVEAAGRPFVSYAADAIVVATPTGSTAYSFSAGGPIVSPAVEALLVTPAAPHSAYNRGLVVSVGDQLTLNVLPTSGQARRGGRRQCRRRGGTWRPDRASAASRRGPRRPARPHHVLRAGPAQATAGRLRGDRRHPAVTRPAASRPAACGGPGAGRSGRAAGAEQGMPRTAGRAWERS